MKASLALTLLPGAEAVGAVHRVTGPQPDNLCGPYWVAILLASAGQGSPSPERVAVAARTLLPASGDPSSWVPPGEPNREGATGSIGRVDDPGVSGTSIRGMVEAVEALSEGSFRLLPLRGRGGQPLDAPALEQLVETLEQKAGWRASPVLNLRTGALWGTRLPIADAFAYVVGEDVQPSEPEWDVGHFVNLAGILRGPERTMAVLRDSYPSFGSGGDHLQPLQVVAEALARGDGREGGCLLFLPAEHALAAEVELKQAGFDTGTWDNGTPYEQGGKA